MSWFSDFVDSIREAFSGGSSNSSQSDSGSGNDRTPPRTRPQQRPSIMTVQRTPQDERQRVATRDIPRFGISAGDTTSEPDYSPFSLRGLTSTDTGNVMRNIQGAERNARAEAARTDADREDRPAPAAAPVAESVSEPAAETPETPVTPAAPATESGMTPEQEERIEQAGETAAEKQRKLGLAQTIATSPRGLLASGEGTTRRRRSLIGGGLIV
jgi:hypothetical protein